MSIILLLMSIVGYFITKDVAWMIAAGMFSIAFSVDKIHMVMKEKKK